MQFFKAIPFNGFFSSRFYKYFLSYLCLIAIVLSILGVTVYRKVILSLQTEVEASNTAVLKHINDLMDMRLREMERTAIDISSNTVLRPYKLTVDSFEAVQELNKYKTGNDFIYDIALYYNTLPDERVFNTRTQSSLDFFFNNAYKYESFNKGELQRLLDTCSFPVMKPVEKVYINRMYEKKFATYIYPIPQNAIKPYGAVIFLIEEEAMKKLLKSTLADRDGFAYILNQKNEMLFSVQEGEEWLDSSKMLEITQNTGTKTGISSISVQNEKFSVLKITSDYNKWTYITASRTDQFLKKVISSRNVFILIIIFVLLLGVVAAFAFAAENYKPLRRLTQMVAPQNADKSAYKDEFALISSAITEASIENKGLMSQLKTKSGMIKGQLLLKLLKGKYASIDEIRDMRNHSGLKLDFPYFTVMVFQMDNYRKLSADKDKIMQNLISLSIVNIVEELAQEIGNGYGIELDDDRSIALLLNFKAEQGRERYISELAFKAKDFFRQHFDITLTVGVGNTFDDIMMVHESFQEAIRAAYYRVIKGNNNVIFYEDIKEIKNRELKYPIEQEKELLTVLKQGKSSEVERITYEIKEYIIRQQLSPESVQYLCFGIVNSLLKALDEMGIVLDEEMNFEKELMFINPFETIDDLVDRINGFCGKLCVFIDKQKESKNFDLRDRILEIITTRYHDNLLSVENIAEKCGVSTSYLSRFFKDQTGYSPAVYIDMLRMDKAKQLLRETKLPLKGVLDQVGYIDESSFIRKFRIKEGVTPIQYRGLTQADNVKAIV